MNEFPWTALLLLRSTETERSSRCGGTLLSDRHVLTAAHCLKEFSIIGRVDVVWDNITVVLGKREMTILEINISECFPGEHDIEDGYETVTFESKVVGIPQPHPRMYYRISTGDLEFDVGILTLETPVNFSDPKFDHIR